MHNENTADENTDNSGENSDNSLVDSDNSQEDSDNPQENSDHSQEDSDDSEENFDKNDCYAAIKILQNHISSKEIIGKKKDHKGKKNKRYACNKCEKTFMRPRALKVHEETVHERKRQRA